MEGQDNLILQQAIRDAGLHFGRVLRLLTDGIAFPSEASTKLFSVFSHEGDFLAALHRHDVESAIAFMKRYGRVVGKCYGTWPGFNKPHGGYGPAYTFAWEDWYIPPNRREGYGETVKQNFLKGLA